MDQYTIDTKKWLDERFRKTTKEGYFYAHQNIYGYKSPLCEDEAVLRYIIVYNVMRALKMLSYKSLLDVGGAEGYMAGMAKKLYGMDVRSCDLSEEACARAREIFNIEADPVDGVKLPYADGAFDVVLCSEALEHIPDYTMAFNEIMRVAAKAAIITVPCEPPEVIAENIRLKMPHGHIHSFTLDSFRNCVADGTRIMSWGLHCLPFKVPYRFLEGRKLSLNRATKLKKKLKSIINPLIKITGALPSKWLFAPLLKLDRFVANSGKNRFDQMIFVIVKDPQFVFPKKLPSCSARTIIDFKVSPYRIP